MILEVGKSYETRSGFKAVIVAMVVGPHPALGYLECGDNPAITEYEPGMWSLDGQSCKTHRGFELNDDFVIVGEWVEPTLFAWSCLPAWANKGIAMNSNGEWRCYSEMPHLNKGGHSCDSETYWSHDGTSEVVPRAFAPLWHGDWSTSWRENPQRAEQIAKILSEQTDTGFIRRIIGSRAFSEADIAQGLQFRQLAAGNTLA